MSSVNGSTRLLGVVGDPIDHMIAAMAEFFGFRRVIGAPTPLRA